MPKAKAPAVNGAPKARKPRAPKGHKLPDPFPCGEILQDNIKKQWRLGCVIGQGGFGLIYMASDNITKDAGSNSAFVVKVEPLSNGPLFCELHFYQRAAKPDMVDNWRRDKKLKYLGVPKFLGAGMHDKNGMKFRFLVMPRFSTDLQKIFESNGRCLPHDAVYSVGLRMIESLEYLHDNCYVHADIKGANLLLGYNSGSAVDDEVYLVDYGLAYRYVVDGVHKEYKEDPRKAHDGTIEYTSRDAHNGVSESVVDRKCQAPSRRGDLEILGYCMVHWMSGKLPWESKLENKDLVQAQKIKYMNNIPSFIKECFPKGDAPVNLSQFLTYVNGLDYHIRPNYDTVKRLFQTALTKLGRKDNGKVFPLFSTPQVTSPSTKRKGKRKSDEAPDTSPIKQTRKTPPAKQTKKPSPARKRPVLTPTRKKVVASPKAKVTPSRKTVKDSAKKGHLIIPGAPGSTIRQEIIPGAPNRVHTPRSKLTKAKNVIANGLPKGRNSPAQVTAASRPKAPTRRRKRTIADVTDAAIQTSPGLGRYT